MYDSEFHYNLTVSREAPMAVLICSGLRLRDPATKVLIVKCETLNLNSVSVGVSIFS